MTDRERFKAIMTYQPVDRLPVWYFGTWRETRQRWQHEGISADHTIEEQTGMDPDWESGRDSACGMVDLSAHSQSADKVIEETETTSTVRTRLGAVLKWSKRGASIPQHIEYALKPTRESWKRFKRYYDPNEQGRVAADLVQRAPAWNARERVACFTGGSLFGWPRDWMGVEHFSCLAYTDPVLLEEILDHLVEYFTTLYRSVLQLMKFDFVYLFEDCCFSTGPLLSPDIYRAHFDKYYRRLIDFYRSMGVDFVLMDSDGRVDHLVPCWLESGVDIVFPIEVGTWRADPVDLRRRFGRELRMMGGVDKHVIPRGEAAIRDDLERLLPLAREGGFIPLPDHRIPPSCSFEQFRTYVRVYKEVFGET